MNGTGILAAFVLVYFPALRSFLEREPARTCLRAAPCKIALQGPE